MCHSLKIFSFALKKKIQDIDRIFSTKSSFSKHLYQSQRPTLILFLKFLMFFYAVKLVAVVNKNSSNLWAFLR